MIRQLCLCFVVEIDWALMARTFWSSLCNVESRAMLQNSIADFVSATELQLAKRQSITQPWTHVHHCTDKTTDPPARPSSS